MTNQQPIEKAVSSSGTLDVHSVFFTIQGEGPFSGQPAVFVRLAGCNLQCPGCDTDYTRGRITLDYGGVMRAIREAEWEGIAKATDLIVISGGEPFRQQLTPFVTMLTMLGYRVQIETNGTLGPDAADLATWCELTCAGRVTVVCSPKAGKINKHVAALLACGLSAVKYVMSSDMVDPEDGLPTFALHHPASPRVARYGMADPGNIYLQPMDEGEHVKNNQNLKACITSCMTYGYRLCLQTHKIIGME